MSTPIRDRTRYDGDMSRWRAHAHAVRFHAAVAIGVVVVIAVVLLRRQKQSIARDNPEEDIATFCAHGLEPIAGGCFAAPPSAPAGTPLIVYLHGRFAANAADEELARQSRLARMATSRGYAVLALRGRLGQCSDPKLADWWCWPSNEHNAQDGPAFVERWDAPLAFVRSRIGAGPRWLLGFSNGGYFATLVMTRALTPFDAVVIAHGGPVQPTRAVGAKPPVLLVNADDGAKEEMQRLDVELTREGWNHRTVTREGGHDLPDWDVDAALTFFEQTQR